MLHEDRFTRQFKIQLVNLSVNGGVRLSALSRKFNLSVQTLRQWRQKYLARIHLWPLTAKEVDESVESLLRSLNSRADVTPPTTQSERPTANGHPRVIVYSVIVGDSDYLAETRPGRGIEFYLFTDDLATPAQPCWQKILLPNTSGMSPRRLSRLPKIRPHLYLPPHDISVYVDANLTLIKPLRPFVLSCVSDRPIAICPHPHTGSLYAEAEKCMRLGLDNEELIRSQVDRYHGEGFPENFGLTENNFIIRRHNRATNELNELWWKEYSTGSQRDQLSLMYCLWKTQTPFHLIPLNSRQNDYFAVRLHRHPPKDFANPRLKRYRNPQQALGLKALISHLSPNTRMAEIGSFTGESAALFAASGKVARLWCVDRWRGRAQEAEVVFDDVQSTFPQIICKIKSESSTAATRFLNQSLDFVYIDATHEYDDVKADLAIWRPKVKPGGFIGGHDYSQKFPGVIRAVHEAFGDPQIVFEDSSWLVQIPSRTFGIVSYCSLSYLDAFEFSIDSWLQRAKADEVVIYTDSPDVEKRATPRKRVSFIHAFSPPVEQIAEYPWERKVETIRKYYDITQQPCFAYLDCDCWVREDFREVFAGMGESVVAGTRLLGRDGRGKGEANAGVIFFRYHPLLGSFLDAWKERLAHYREKNKDRFYDQDALSHIIIEAFDGIHPFRASLVSEHLYNCEHDSNDLWLKDIEKYRPKIIHFKARRFRNKQLSQEVFSRLAISL